METERLILRQWQPSDFEPFAQLNQDRDVMEHFPSLPTTEETQSHIKRFIGHFEKHGYGLWAVELKENNQFIGFIGLQNVPFDAPFAPAVEIGWRLAKPFWGKGYALEGAKACIDYAFNTLNLNKIVSFTAIPNKRSIKLMERLGMSFQSTFTHPALPADHPLALHVLYSLEVHDCVF